MFWVIVIIAIVVFVLFEMGVFRKRSECQCCGKTLKGTEQYVFNGNTKFCLCQECTDKIHPQILEYAQKNWSYTDYADYVAWEEATKEERAMFDPDAQYGHNNELKVDTERGLFSLGSRKNEGLVFRFADLTDYELNFKPEEVKEGFITDKVKGNEFVMVELETPRVLLEKVVNKGVKLPLRKKGIISTKYEYEFSDAFMEIIRAFTICVYI